MDTSLVAVVIPCYKVEKQIEKVVAEIPECVHSIILVNDCSPDNTKEVLMQLAENNRRVTIIQHEKNQGVGGAMITGFKEAIRQNSSVVIKIDGDGQMNASYIPKMIKVLSQNKCDFVKGNRFFDRKMLKKMPLIRRIGNLLLGFLIKMASGYWNIFDPSNGFLCIRTTTLKKLDFERLSKRFFFESSLLIELYYTGAKIKDVAMPSIYENEKSNLSITKVMFTFPPKLLKALVRRIWLRYFIYDFNINSLYILLGIPSFFFGLIFGIVKWIHYSSLQIGAPTGTIVVALLSFILGLQMLLSVIQHDISNPSPFETIFEDEEE